MAESCMDNRSTDTKLNPSTSRKRIDTQAGIPTFSMMPISSHLRICISYLNLNSTNDISDVPGRTGTWDPFGSLELGYGKKKLNNYYMLKQSILVSILTAFY